MKKILDFYDLRETVRKHQIHQEHTIKKHLEKLKEIAENYIILNNVKDSLELVTQGNQFVVRDLETSETGDFFFESTFEVKAEIMEGSKQAIEQYSISEVSDFIPEDPLDPTCSTECDNKTCKKTKLQLGQLRKQLKDLHAEIDRLKEMQLVLSADHTIEIPKIAKCIIDEDNNRDYGRNVIISERQFDHLMEIDKGRKNDPRFVNLALTLVFGTEVLKISSLTGEKCRTKKDKEPSQKLDPGMLNIVRGGFKFPHFLCKSLKTPKNSRSFQGSADV